MGLAKSLKANQGKSIGKWEVFPSSKFDSGAVPVRRSRSLRGRGRLISFDITPTTFSDFVLLRTNGLPKAEVFGRSRRLSLFGLSKDTRRRSSPLPFFSFSPLFFDLLRNSNIFKHMDPAR